MNNLLQKPSKPVKNMEIKKKRVRLQTYIRQDFDVPWIMNFPIDEVAVPPE